jgi:hypothetical protein
MNDSQTAVTSKSNKQLDDGPYRLVKLTDKDSVLGYLRVSTTEGGTVGAPKVYLWFMLKGANLKDGYAIRPTGGTATTRKLFIQDMKSNDPEGYFQEAIVSPNISLVDPGYIATAWQKAT